jgi:large subunit ribosomal protein L22
MSHSAIHRYARIAPRKARFIADLIRGLDIDEALTELELSKRRGAAFFKGVLRSAIANAEEADATVNRLFISESRVDEGPTIKRFQPKDRGRAHPIHKRTSHLHVTVDERP